MSRQFKAMQEKHLAKIGALERSTQELHEQLEGKAADVARLHAEHAGAVADKDMLIKELRHKQEVMAQEFAEMLRETLDKMADCLEVTDVAAPEGA
jgi:type I site-specific restriction endonuclease